MIREIFGKEIDMSLNPTSLEIVKLSHILAEQSKDLVIVPKRNVSSMPALKVYF